MKRLAIIAVAVLALVACEEDEPDPNDTQACRNWQTAYAAAEARQAGNGAVWLSARPEGCDIP
jgi:uncharacterized lipoprotein YbaY